MKHKEILINWNVITGGPCTGKTNVVNILAERGYETTIEHARQYIDMQKIVGRTIEEIRENKKGFYHEFNGDLTEEGWPPDKSIS